MGDIEVGKCEVCGKEEVQLHRTYINFPNIKCECHNSHFELIRHCIECKPVVPKETTLIVSVDMLRAIDMMISNHKDEYQKTLAWCEKGHECLRNCDETPFQRNNAANACEGMYMSD